MKTLLMIVTGLCLGTGLAVAGTHVYGWEDGGKVLGFYGTNADETDVMFVSAVGAPDPVFQGSMSLKLEDNMLSGTPQAFLAFVWGLQPNDTVTASFWRYDVTLAAAPSCRLWGHWNDDLPGDYFGYSGSASGQGDYGPGTGWDVTVFDFINADSHTGLVIECRTYSNPGDIVYIDNLEVTIPDHASIMLPSAGFVGTEETSFGSVKALFR
ncbi:MAG: hypothetical protein ABFS42_16205 [Candidatus Krumholzibacteriota bacterium]